MYVCVQKVNKNRLAVDKVIAQISRLTFLAHRVQQWKITTEKEKYYILKYVLILNLQNAI